MTDRSARLHTPVSERLTGAIGAAAMLGLLGAGLIWGLAAGRQVVRETSTALIDLEVAPPPPPRERPPGRRRARAAAETSSPRNLRNHATPLVAPQPVVQAPPPPITVAPLANSGSAAQTGASDRAGPGQGAGGQGHGFGGGGQDEGGPGYTAPEQLNALKYGYLAPELRARGAQGTAEVIFHVTDRGHVDSCDIRISSGDRGLDAGICQAILLHLRFRPSRDPTGRPVGANIIANHGWIIDREDDPTSR